MLDNNGMRKKEEEKKNSCKERNYVLNSPKSDQEYFSQYIYALDKIIDNDDVCNIGIVSPYGSGKSSFVKSFFNKYPDRKKKMNLISLASFDNKENFKNDVACDEYRIYKNRIERSILEQIVYKRKYCFKSKSRIERIHGRLISICLFSFLLVATIVLSLLSVAEFYEMLPSSNGKNFYWYFSFAAVAAFFTVIFLLRIFNINKVAASNIEIEFNKERDGSILNQFVDEIINYCAETKVRYFIFEDIDRFDDSIDLFLKLREINTLINENEGIKNKVAFIYCVKEGIFNKAEDRAKFFDFSISLVPIYNPENASRVFMEAINNNNDLSIKEEDVKEISLFVKDIRVFKTIINDYIFYKDILKTEDANNVKLFAMMVYKNLYFNDFSLLQLNSGILYNCFNEYKTESIEKANEKENALLDELKQKMIDAPSSNSISEEIKMLRERISGIIAIHGLSDSRQPQGYTNNDFVSTYKGLSTGLFINVTIKTPYYQSSNIFKYLSLDTLKSYLNGKTPYELEESIIYSTKQYYAKEIKKLEESISGISNLTVCELLQSGRLLPKYLEIISKNDYLKFAIINGYIDESYFLYSGHPDVNMDNEFLRSILNREKIKPDQIVRNPSIVILKLRIDRFRTPSVLNYCLVDALFDRSNKYKNKREAFVKYLLKKDDDTRSFLLNYFSFGKRQYDLLLDLHKHGYYDLVSDLAPFDTTDGNSISHLIFILLEHIDDDALINCFNTNNEIKDILENDSHIIERYFTHFKDINGFIAFLKLVNVECIKHVDDMRIIENSAMNKCLSFIFENCLLEINAYNLSVVGSVIFRKNNVSVGDLLGNNNDTISEYYNNNLKLTIEALSNIGEKFSDDIKTVKRVLLDENLDDEDKNKYILLLDNRIEYIKGLSPKVYSTILCNNLMERKWKALIELDKETSIDQGLVAKYIETNIDTFVDTTTDSKYFVKLANNSNIGRNTFEKICNYFIVKVAINDITDDGKRSLAIRYNKVALDNNSLLVCRNMDLSFCACLDNGEEQIKMLPSAIGTQNDYLKWLKSESISDKTKTIIVKLFYDNIIALVNDDNLDVLQSIFTKSQNYDFDKKIIIDFEGRIKGKKEKESFITAFDRYFDDKDIIRVTKNNDPNLFETLSKPGIVISLELQYVSSNYYYKLLENHGIIRTTNRRVHRCQTNTKVFKDLI